MTRIRSDPVRGVSRVMFEWFYGLDMQVLYPVTIILIAGAAELGNGFMRRRPKAPMSGRWPLHLLAFSHC
jgi:hypothetical protein